MIDYMYILVIWLATGTLLTGAAYFADRNLDRFRATTSRCMTLAVLLVGVIVMPVMFLLPEDD